MVYGIDIAVDVLLFFVKVSADRRIEFGPFEPVGRPCRDRRKATTYFMFALSSRFESLQAVPDAIVDALVVTGLKMKRIDLRVGTPVTAIQGIVAAVKNGCRISELFFSASTTSRFRGSRSETSTKKSQS